MNARLQLRFVYFNDGFITGGMTLDALSYGFRKFLVRHAELIWDYYIKCQFGAGRFFDEMEIVHGDRRIDLCQTILDQRLHAGSLLISQAYRIHVDHGVAV